METCPECKGEKRFWALMHYEHKCEWGWMSCYVCGGKGIVTQQKVKLRRYGESIRIDRIKRGLSMREEATRLKLTPYEYSCRETGKVPK